MSLKLCAVAVLAAAALSTSAVPARAFFIDGGPVHSEPAPPPPPTIRFYDARGKTVAVTADDVREMTLAQFRAVAERILATRDFVLAQSPATELSWAGATIHGLRGIRAALKSDRPMPDGLTGSLDELADRVARAAKANADAAEKRWEIDRVIAGLEAR